MSPAPTQAVVLCVLFAVCLVTGRLLVHALGLRRLRRLSPDSAAASAFLGAASWTVGFALLSGPAGLPARPATGGVALALGGAALVAWKRRGWQGPRHGGSGWGWLALSACSALTAWLALLPVVEGEGFAAGNDTLTYCALADWLQLHGFGGAVGASPDGLVDAIALQRREMGFALGAAYPLAMALAASGASTSLALYPAVSALGLVLGLWALWWAMRRIVRAPVSVSAAVVLAFAATPHAGYWAHHQGFLSQTLAVPALVTGLVALGTGRGPGDRTGLVLAALAAAFLYFVYLPFLPLLTAAGAVRVAADLAADPASARRLAVRLGLLVSAFLLLVGLDVVAPARGLLHLLRAPVGGHVPVTPAGLATTALGPGPGSAPGPPDLAPAAATAWTVAAACLAVIGIVALRRDRRAIGLFAALVVILLLLGWNGFVARDPWTGERGHSWSLFKAAQWAFPLLLLCQGRGLVWLRRRARGIEVLFALAALALAPAHGPWSRELGRGLRGLVDGERPLRALPRVVGGFRGLPAGQILLLGQPAAVSPFRAGYASLLAWPRPVAGDWESSASVAVDPATARALHDGLVARVGEAGVVPLLADAPPFDVESREDLGGGYARLTSLKRPRLVQIAAPRPEERGRTKLLVLAPRDGPVEVVLDLDFPSASEPARLVWQAVPTTLGGVAFRRAAREAPARVVDVRRGRATVLRFEAQRGLNTVALSSEERAAWRVTGLALRP